MTPRLLGLVLGSTLVLTTTLSAAQAAPRAFVAPVHGGSSCRNHEPVLLGAGANPRARVRIELDALANRSRSAVETVKVYSKSRVGTSAWKGGHGTQKMTVKYQTAAPVGGRLPVDVTFGVPGASSKESAQLDRIHLSGFFDALNGGTLRTTVKGGSAKSRAALKAAFSGSDGPVTDHLPRQAVGIGATWRIVRCDAIDGTPAKESRVYTLRSIRHGVVVASFHETIGLDPAHVDLGKTKLGTELVGVRLLSLHGTSTGTERLPLGNALAEQDSKLAKIAVVVRFARAHAPDLKVEQRVVLQRTFK